MNDRNFFWPDPANTRITIITITTLDNIFEYTGCAKKVTPFSTTLI